MEKLCVRIANSEHSIARFCLGKQSLTCRFRYADSRDIARTVIYLHVYNAHGVVVNDTCNCTVSLSYALLFRERIASS